MKHISLFIAVFLSLAAVFTLSAQDAVNTAVNPIGNTVPQNAPSSGVFRQEGIASWYGAEFAGRPTASGELFNPAQFTAAHPSLPFGTLLKVTSRHNNRQVVVRVNDRGPYVSARIIDVSQAAAEALDMITTGTAPVLVEIAEGGTVTPPPTYQYTPAPLTAAPQQPVLTIQQYQVPQGYPYQPGEAAPAQPVYPGYQAEAVPAQPSYPYQPAPAAPQPYPGYPAEAAPSQPAYPYQPAPGPAAPQPYPGYQPGAASGQPAYPYQPAPAAPQPYPGYPTYQPTPADAIVVQPGAPAAYPAQPAPAQVLPSGVIPAAIKPVMPPLGTGLRYRVQIGSYKTTKNAVEAFDRLVTLGFQPNYERYQDFYRVVISGVPAEDMELIAERLGAGGFREVLIREEH